VQYRGFRRVSSPEALENVADAADAYELPQVEKIQRRRADTGTADDPNIRVFDTVVRIERRVDLSPHTSGEFSEYVTKFADKNRQFAVKNVGSMAVTYFPGHIMRQALHDRYPDYGKNLRATEKIQKGIMDNFRNFVRSALIIHREAEEFKTSDLLYTRGPEDPRLTFPSGMLSDAWVDAVAILKPAVKVLDNRYIVADLSANDYFEEERAKISDFLRNEEGLRIDDRPYNGDRIPHLTLAETRAGTIRSYPLTTAPLPYDVRLKAPELYARIGVPIYM
jgi:hypothetical protein